jgi:hypothetical protein
MTAMRARNPENSFAMYLSGKTDHIHTRKPARRRFPNFSALDGNENPPATSLDPNAAERRVLVLLR